MIVLRGVKLTASEDGRPANLINTLRRALEQANPNSLTRNGGIVGTRRRR